jgi:DNA-binding NarL/FixJ family response regulator
MTPTRLLVADDQPLVRSGLRRIIEADPGLVVVGEAGNGDEAVRQVVALRPDIVLMDVRMPVMDGIEATRRIRAQADDTRVIILTTFGLDEVVVDALRSGASAFVLKEAPPERILAAIAEVAGGRAVLDPAVTQTVIDQLGLRESRPDLVAQAGELTPREHEVLQLIARGLSNAEIAAQLVISEGTTKTHVAHILSKLTLRDRAQAIVFAHDAGIV